jgi:FdhE protein
MCGSPRPDPGVIGRALPPPFARLPEPEPLFSRRAARFEALAGAGHGLGPYLGFLAGLARAQVSVLPGLPAPALPEPGRTAMAVEHAMPPLDRAALGQDDAAIVTLAAFFDAAAALPMPGEAAEALGRLRRGGQDRWSGPVAAVLAEAVPTDRLAEHAFVAAGLQVHATRAAARLHVSSLRRVGQGLCPVCGGAPVASLVVGWPGAENARYCACWLCGTLWNEVRVKCVSCGSTAGISFLDVEGSDGRTKAECCEACHSYLKCLYDVRFPDCEAIADDVGSLDLDLLLREQPYERAGFNPFLLGV